MELLEVNSAIEEASGYLDDCISGAQEWLTVAADKAEDASCEGQWKPVAELAEKLKKIRADLDAAITPEIKKLIADAKAESDYWADMADANSY